MPAAATSAYSRVIYNGVPYWKDPEGILYYYAGNAHPTSETRIRLGTESAGLDSNWKEVLEDTLSKYRDQQRARGRAATPAPAAPL